MNEASTGSIRMRSAHITAKRLLVVWREGGGGTDVDPIGARNEESHEGGDVLRARQHDVRNQVRVRRAIELLNLARRETKTSLARPAVASYLHYFTRPSQKKMDLMDRC